MRTSRSLRKMLLLGKVSASLLMGKIFELLWLTASLTRECIIGSFAKSFHNKETSHPLQSIPLFSMFRQIVFFVLFSFLSSILIYFNLTVAEDVTKTSIDRSS